MDEHRICIWCKNSPPDVTFYKIAHIFPRSLGGSRVCKNVCDDCNSFFGSKQAGVASVEIALKEPLNISRYFLLTETRKKTASGASERLPRFKSEYFKYDTTNHIVKPKTNYSYFSDFQTMFVKQFKRGIYKIFLEERSECIGDALSPQFDFIREFSRYGIGDYPVFYCQPSIPAVFMSKSDLKDPVIRFTEYSEDVMKRFGFYSYYFITHEIAFPVIRTFELTIENYVKFILTKEKRVISKMVLLRKITDIDFTFSFAFGNNE